MMSLSEEENKDDILALALSNAATDASANESSMGLLDFLNIDPVVDNSILPADPLAITPTVVDPLISAGPIQRLPPITPVPQDDDLMDMLGLSDDKLDTISNNELDSLLEEASKIEVPKDVEIALNSPRVVDANHNFKLPQLEIKLPQASPLVPTTSSNLALRPLPSITKPITIPPVAQPVTQNTANSMVPSTANKIAQNTANKIALNTANRFALSTVNTAARNTIASVTPNTGIGATQNLTSTVASKFSVTKTFKMLGTTTKPILSIKGQQQLINLLNTTIVNTSTAAASSALSLPVLSLASTSRTTSPAVTTTDRRYCVVIIHLVCT